MNIVPRNSLFDIDNLFDHLFFRNTQHNDEANFFAPRVDIREQKNKYMLEAELPGVEAEDLDIEFHNGTLTISAKTETEDSEEKDGKVIRRERRYGAYHRSFYLGDGIDESAIKASFKNGVLKLTLPKPSEAQVKSRKIAVD